MAAYDKDTERFITDVSDSSRKKAIEREAFGIAKDVVKGKPIAQSLAAHTLRAGTKELLSKTGSLTALTVYEWLTGHYQDLWQDWELETLEKTLADDFEIKAGEELKNLLQALQVICKTNAPFEDWQVFEKVGHALNESPVNFGYVQPMEMDEIAWAVVVLRTIRPRIEFEPEVSGYIAACAKHSGLVFLPEDYFPKESQFALDHLGYNDSELSAQVSKLWPNTSIQGDTALWVQGARLAEIKEYVSERRG